MENQSSLSLLQAYFKEKGIMQKEIADRLGVSQPYVNSLLKGKKSFGKRQAVKWSEEFGLSSSWLITGEGDMVIGSVFRYNKNGNNINGHSVSVESPETDELIKLLKKTDEQIDRLITLLEKK